MLCAGAVAADGPFWGGLGVGQMIWGTTIDLHEAMLRAKAFLSQYVLCQKCSWPLVVPRELPLNYWWLLVISLLYQYIGRR